MGCMKVSAAMLVRDFAFESKSWKMVSMISLFVTVLWTIGAPLIITIGCTPIDAQVQRSISAEVCINITEQPMER